MKNHLTILLTLFCSILPMSAIAAQKEATESIDWFVEFGVTELNIIVGETAEVPVTFTPVEPEEYSLEWKSLNTKVATVDASGLVTGVAPGITTIEVNPTGLPVFPYGSSLKVTVTGNDIDHIRLITDGGEHPWLDGADFIPERVNDITRITAWLNGNDITTDAIWTSSDEAVATVTAEGNRMKVKAVNTGEAVISAVYEKDGVEYTATLKFVVVETFHPLLKQPTDVTGTGFTISWDPVSVADCYSVNVAYYNDTTGEYEPYEVIRTTDTTMEIAATPEKSDRYRCIVATVINFLWGDVQYGWSEPIYVNTDNFGTNIIKEDIDNSVPYENQIDISVTDKDYSTDGSKNNKNQTPVVITIKKKRPTTIGSGGFGHAPINLSIEVFLDKAA